VTRDQSWRGLADPVQLRAGQIDLELRGPDLAHAWWGGREVVRRIYVAVRDEAWSTVLPELMGRRVEESPESFAIWVDVRHRQGPVDFRWQGVIEGAADGSFSYTMDGEALSDFRYGRIGLCVLHAAEGYVGKPFVARSGGSASRGVLPVEIAPQRYRDGFYQPAIPEFEALDVQLARDLRVEFAFAGDMFEIEDQRNWTDASFKTYSTPLRLGYPHQAAAGQQLRQRVTVRAHGNQPQARRRRGPGATAIKVGESIGRALPAVGSSAPADVTTMSPRTRALVRKLSLAHVRTDIRLGCDGAESALERGAAFARAAGAALELALHANRESARRSAELLQLLPADVPLARILVLDDSAEATQAEAARTIRRGLSEVGLSAPVGGGTALWFAELNRDPPDSSALDFLAYGLCPQLHLFDDAALMETLAVQGTTVGSARALGGGRPVIIGPVMLMPPVGGAAGQDAGFGEGVDPRQRSLFCAAWTLGSLKQLARAGVEAVTYFEALGPRGLIDAGAGLDLDGARSARAAPYPVHQILVEMSRMAGGDVRMTESSQPLRAEALACSDGERLRLLVANFRPAAQEVIIEGLPPGIATIRAIKASVDPSATEGVGPLTFVTRRVTTRGSLRLTLNGYEFARVAVPDQRLATIRQLGRRDAGARSTAGAKRELGRQVRR
jgi:D-apionolactonase